MANSEWFDLFPRSRSDYLKFEGSDHRPIVSFLGQEKKKKRGMFRYDRRLTENEEVKSIIEEAWFKDKLVSVQFSLSNCRRAIIKWTKDKQKNSQVEINRLK